FGLHPSRGLVPQFPELMWNPHQGIGPMTRDVRDAAILLRAIAGHDPRDPLTRTTEVPDYPARLDDGVAGVRFAWSADFGFIDPVDARVVQTVAEAASVFEEAGGIVESPALRLEDIWDALRRFPVMSVEKSYAGLEKLPPAGSPPLVGVLPSLRGRPGEPRPASGLVVFPAERS